MKQSLRQMYKNEDELVNYAEIFQQHRWQGNFQLRTFFWFCIPTLFPGIVIMSYTFTGAAPDYRCFTEVCDSSMINSLFDNSSVNNVSLISQEKTQFQCYYLNSTSKALHHECFNFSANTNSLEKCDRWIYDLSVFQSTIVTEFNLVCDNEWKQTVSNSLFMFGMLIGSITIGTIGDIIGRKLTFTLNTIVLASVTTASAFSPDWIFFCGMRFLSGIGASGHFLITFIWGIEVLGDRYRVVCGFLFQIIFAVGCLLLGLLAYFIRNWRSLQLAISTPMFGLICLHWLSILIKHSKE